MKNIHKKMLRAKSGWKISEKQEKFRNIFREPEEDLSVILFKQSLGHWKQQTVPTPDLCTDTN